MALSISDLLLRIRTDKGDSTRSVDELAASLQALDHTKATATAQVDTDKGAFDELQAQLDIFDHKKVDAKAGVDTKQGEAQLALFSEQLSAFAARSFKGSIVGISPGEATQMLPHGGQLTMDLGIDPAKAEGELIAIHEQLQLELKALPLKEKLDVDTSTVDKLKQTEAFIGRLENVFGSLSSAGAGVGQSLSSLGEQLGKVTVNFGAFGARLGPVVAALILAAVVIGTSLVSALIAVASSAVLAATALAAMGVALVGALAPIALIAIPAVLMFGKVIQALNSSQTDSTKAARDNATAINQQIAAHRAATAYAQQHADAERSLSQAEQTLADATKAAYREMEDAINKVTEAYNALNDAKDQAAQSKLDFQKAKQALADFLQNLGVGKKQFDAFFKTFSDVGFDPSKLNAALAKIKPPGMSKDDTLTLEQLILDVTKARHGEADATEGVHNAQTDLNRARQDEIPFLQKGIAGSKNYQAALQGVADAERNLHRLESNRAQDLKDMAAQQAAANAATDAALTKTQRLSPEETKLLNAIKGLISVVKKDLGPAINAVFDGLIAGLKGLAPALDKMKGPLTDLGKAMGGAITDFFKLMTSPGSLKLFDALIKGAQQLLPFIDKIFAPMLDILGKIAVAAMPFLVQGFKAVAGFLADMDKRTTVKNIGKWLGEAVPNLTAIAVFIITAIPALFKFFKQVAPYGIQFLTFITGIAKQFGQWATSKKGRDEIHDFFKNTIPNAIGVLNAVIQIAHWFVVAYGAIGDALTPLANFFSAVYNGLSTVTNILTGANPFDLIKNSIEGVLSSIGVTQFFNAGKDIVGSIIDGVNSGNIGSAIIGVLKGAFSTVEGFLPGWVVGLFKDGAKLITGLFNGIKSTDFINGFLNWIKGALSTNVENFIQSLPGKFFDWGKNIINGLWNGIKSVGLDIWGWLKSKFNDAINGLNGLWQTFFDIGAFLVKGLWKGLTSVVLDVVKWVEDHVPAPIRWALKIFSPSKVMEDIGKQIGKGLEVGLDASGAGVQRAAMRSLSSPVMAAAGAGGSGVPAGGMVIQNQNVNLPAAPGHDQMGDPRHQAALFAREMRRRGWR